MLFVLILAHAFVGQYQCGCVSSDAVQTVIPSNPTEFNKEAFFTGAFNMVHGLNWPKDKREIVEKGILSEKNHQFRS